MRTYNIEIHYAFAKEVREILAPYKTLEEHEWDTGDDLIWVCVSGVLYKVVIGLTTKPRQTLEEALIKTKTILERAREDILYGRV